MTSTRSPDLAGVVSAWRSTFEALSGGVVLLDRDGRVVTLNRAAAALLGADPRACEGHRMRDLLDLPDLDDPQLLSSPERVAFEATTGSRWLRLAFDPMTADGYREGTVVTM